MHHNFSCPDCQSTGFCEHKNNAHLSLFKETSGKSNYICPYCHSDGFCSHKEDFFYSGAHILLPGVGESAMSFGKKRD